MPPSTLTVNLHRAVTTSTLAVASNMETSKLVAGDLLTRSGVAYRISSPNQSLVFFIIRLLDRLPRHHRSADESACELKGGLPSIDMSLDAARKSA